LSTGHSQTFGMLLKRYRLASGLTQAELAERAGLSPEAVSALERGVNRAPRKDTVTLLADALALPEQERALLERAGRQHKAAARPPVLSTPGRPGILGTPAPLVGRRQEISLVQQLLDGILPPALFLTGEPGVGKTRLLREAAREAASQGWTVLTGECQRQGGQIPFAPLLSTFERYILQQSRGQQQLDLAGCAWLVRLLPELVEMGVVTAPAWTLPPEQERRLMFAAASRFLGNVAGPSGTLLILDDLHWADSDGCDLLATLIRSGGGQPGSLRVLGAFRDTEVSASKPVESSLSTMIADLAHSGLAITRAVPPLGSAESAELLHHLLKEVAGSSEGGLVGTTSGTGLGGEPDAEQLVVRQAGGIPYYLVSWAQALRSGALEAERDDAARLVPWDILQSVRQRVAALPPVAHEVLRVAAVAGSVTPRGLLLAMVGQQGGRSEEEVISGIETACQARLLVESTHDTYQFAHELIRDVVIHDLSLARRATLHRRIAEVLERGPGEAAAEALAYHFGLGDEPARAALYLEQAADRAAGMRAHAAAESYYRELVERYALLDQVLDAARAQEKLGVVLLSLTHYQPALDVFSRAAATYRSGSDFEAWGRVEALIGQCHADQGTPREGLARLQPLLSSSSSGESSYPFSAHTRAALYDMEAQLLHVAGEYSRQLEAAERAASYAREAKDEPLLCQIEMRRGNALRMLGRLGEAVQVLEEVIQVAESMHDERNLAYALDNASGVFLLRGEFAKTVEYVMRAYDLMERLGDPLMIALLMLRRGMNEFALGKWQPARADFELAHQMTGQLGVSWVSAYTSLGLGQCDLARGEREQALALLEESVALAGRSGDLQALRWAQASLAEYDLLEDQPEAARGRLEPLLDRPGLQEGLVTYIMPYIAWAYLEKGELSRAEGYVRECLERAAGERIRLAWVDALRVRALIAIHRHQAAHGTAGNDGKMHDQAGENTSLADAQTALDEAIQLCLEMGFPYELAKLYYTQGMLAIQAEDTAGARRSLQEAKTILESLGERLYLERVERLLLRLD
jgi:transcriptional regulator with XRE-family HTH domain/tetratricopeptide (TPR) repeat protein